MVQNARLFRPKEYYGTSRGGKTGKLVQRRVLLDGAKVAAAAGGRCRRYSEVTNQGAMRSATSEQGDYDLEG